MRDIKFRGRNPYTKKWLYGSLLKRDNHNCAIVTFETLNSPWNEIYVDDDTVGQYSDLHDCNGKEIYEGDVIRNKANLCFYLGYDSNFARYVALHPFSSSIQRYLDPQMIKDGKYTIIGNMHDNPELLDCH